MFHSRKRLLNLVRCLIAGIILAFISLPRLTQPALADEPTVTLLGKPITVEIPPKEIEWQTDQCSVKKPEVVSRTAWGCPDGQESPHRPPQYAEVTHFIIHQTETPNDIAPYQDYAGWVRSVWDFHANVLGWGDVGYNYLIDPNGVIYEGRAGGDNVIGIHDTHNDKSLSIGLIGCYDNCNDPRLSVAEPSAAMLDSTAKLIAWQLVQQGIDPFSSAEYNDLSEIPVIAGGRDVVSTSSPGDNIYNRLPILDAELAARVLREIGFSAADVFPVLIDVFELSEEQAITLLKNNCFDTFELEIVKLAIKFAPQLRFDGSARDFPMSAEVYYDAIIATGHHLNPPDNERTCDEGGWGKTKYPDPHMSNEDDKTLATGEIPTYYRGILTGDQVRILYGFFYGFQYPCQRTPGILCRDDEYEDSSHHGDWERIMVTLSEDREKIAAVTYWQHGGHYTRLAGENGFGIYEQTHPVVYVGKKAHGSYYDQGGGPGGPAECAYWGDYRNNDGRQHLWLDTWNNLVSLTNRADEESWMAAERSGTFPQWNGKQYWGWDGCSTHPTTTGDWIDIGNIKACQGTNDGRWAPLETNGCYESQCKLGDRYTWPCCHHCAKNYTDMGMTCTNWNWGSWHTYRMDAYDARYMLDYKIPTNDAGLLHTVQSKTP